MTSQGHYLKPVTSYFHYLLFTMLPTTEKTTLLYHNATCRHKDRAMFTNKNSELHWSFSKLSRPKNNKNTAALRAPREWKHRFHQHNPCSNYCADVFSESGKYSTFWRRGMRTSMPLRTASWISCSLKFSCAKNTFDQAIMVRWLVE